MQPCKLQRKQGNNEKQAALNLFFFVICLILFSHPFRDLSDFSSLLEEIIGSTDRSLSSDSKTITKRLYEDESAKSTDPYKRYTLFIIH